MDIKASNYHDFGIFTELRREAQQVDGDAAKPVAKQFEAIFMQMMLKSMRDTIPESSLLNDESMRFYQDMMDKQLSLHLSERGGIGLADTIAAQLAGSEQEATEAAVRQQLRTPR